MDRAAQKKEQKNKYDLRYKKEVFPYLKGYEVLRKRLNTRFNLIIWLPCVLYVIAWLCVICVECGAHYSSIERIIFITISPAILIIFFALAFAYRLKESKKFFVSLKDNCLEYLLQVFGDIQWSNDKNVITNANLNRSKLFSRFNKRTTDDEFFGTCNGIKFKVCETNLIYESGSGKGRTYVNVFNGVVLEFKLPSSTKIHTMISTKGDLTARDNGWISVLTFIIALIPAFQEFFEADDVTCLIFPVAIIIFLLGLFVYFLKDVGIKHLFISEKKMEKIILEDVKFNKKYHVYSDDQVEARCIVTPAFMEKFLNLRTAFGAKNAKCAFYGNKVMFAISTNQNLFEIGSLNKTLLEPKAFKKLFDEISAIYDIIDYFKLDEK